MLGDAVTSCVCESCPSHSPLVLVCCDAAPLDDSRAVAWRLRGSLGEAAGGVAELRGVVVDTLALLLAAREPCGQHGAVCSASCIRCSPSTPGLSSLACRQAARLVHTHDEGEAVQQCSVASSCVALAALRHKSPCSSTCGGEMWRLVSCGLLCRES